MNTGPKNIIACDPGWSGGFVKCCPGFDVVFEPMPTDPTGIVSVLATCEKESTLVIEQVGGFCGTGHPGSAMFRFGENFGIVLGAAISLGFRIERIAPQKWMKAHGLGTKGNMGKAEWKRKLKSKASELYPEIKVTLQMADALLIFDAKARGLI